MSPPRARPRLKNSGLVWVEETDRQTDRRQLPGDVYEPLDPAVPEVLLPQTLHLPSRVHLLLNQLEAQLRTPALPRHERFLSNRGVCSDFIVPRSPIYPVRRNKTAAEGGCQARAHPPPGPFPRSQGAVGIPGCRPLPWPSRRRHGAQRGADPRRATPRLRSRVLWASRS